MKDNRAMVPPLVPWWHPATKDPGSGDPTGGYHNIIIRDGTMGCHHGIALIVAILILVTLAAIATPFVISMLYKEKITKNTFYQTHTRFSALSARNHAISLLIRSHNSYERQTQFPAPFDTPDYDTLEEFKVDFDAYGFSSAIETTNPKGKILGCEVQDEQGKINIKTAPPAAISNLKDLIPARPAGGALAGESLAQTNDITDFVTEYSYRSSNWIAPVQLRGYEGLASSQGKQIHQLYIDLPVPSHYFTDRPRIRVSYGNGTTPGGVSPRGKEFFAYVDLIVPWKDVAEEERIERDLWYPYAPYAKLRLDRTIPSELLTPQTIIEVEQRHSININTAPRKVLMANLINVGQRIINKKGKVTYDDRITEDQARLLVELIKSRVFKNPMDYLNFLSATQKQGIISARQYRYLLYNGSASAYSCIDLVDEKFTQTLPFCFQSYDKYSLISTGILNYPSGVQAAQTTNREVVGLEPGGIVVWNLKSQYDFDREFETPYGNKSKLVTYPRLTRMTWPSQSYIMPDQSPLTGALKLRTAEDGRGNSVIKSEHFSNMHEGKKQSGSPLTYNSKQIFTFLYNREIQPGGIEMWVKPESLNPPVYFYDIRQGDYENRISLYYTGGELILQVADATLETKTAQVRASLTLRTNTWYHLGAYWKGTKYAQLALFVDGFPVGNFAHYDKQDTAIITELSAELTDQIDTSKEDGAGLIVEVTSTASFPAQGVIEIGDEAIEYDGTTATGFRVKQIWDRTPKTPVLIYDGRGARGSEVKNHPAGAKVTLYGYANTLAKHIKIPGYPPINLDRLTIGGGRLMQAIPDHTVSTTLYKPPVIEADGNIIQESGITADDTQIPADPDPELVSGDLIQQGFPTEGYLKIRHEVIYYNGIGTMGILDFDGNQIEVPCFMNCQRGSLETTKASHRHGTRIELYSIKVTEHTGYLDPALIQIDNEWIGPVQKVGTNYFTGIIQRGQQRGRPLPLQRGFAGTSLGTHTTGTELIPVFAVADPYSGSGDTVTIIEPDQTQPKEERAINLARQITYTIITRVGTRLVKKEIKKYLAAFTQNVSREYPIDGRVTRLLKFPSDELPSYLPDTLSVGEFTGLIDEIRFFQGYKGNFRLSGALSADGNEKEIRMNGVSGLSTSGVVKVGDEIIGYADIDSGEKQLLYCQRGYLNTPIQSQDPDQRAFHLSSMLPVTSLENIISARANEIPLKSLTGLMSEGYLLIDNEVIGYTWRGSNLVAMPEDAKEVGLYRGAFGTQPAFHDAHSLVYAIPFRYWDRYQSSAFDTTMAYFRAATRVTNGIFRRVRWNVDETSYNLARLKILARLDSKPSWDTTPTNRKEGIFEFTDPQGNNLINVEADQIEIMVVFEYRPGAFQSGAWKHSPRLSGIQVEYERKPATMTMYHLEE